MMRTASDMYDIVCVYRNYINAVYINLTYITRDYYIYISRMIPGLAPVLCVIAPAARKIYDGYDYRMVSLLRTGWNCSG